MMTPRIVAGSCDVYEMEPLKRFIAEALARFDASLNNVRVLLKPNLLVGKPAAKAVNTHPVIIEALAEILLDHRCEVFIGDSPGYESTEKALEKSGIMNTAQKLGLKPVLFNKQIKKINNGVSPYHELVLGEDPLEYDAVINLPKLKTHTMMGLTAGVKNTFGFIPSFEKGKWHLRCGKDKHLFAALLIDIHRAVKPALTLLDGILAMDGDGPNHGRPRHAGLIALTNDAFVLDAFLEKMLAFPIATPVTDIAGRAGLLREPELIDLGMPEIKDFRMASTMNIDFNLPSMVRGIARHVFTRKPKCITGKCKLCATCVDVCPAGALSINDKKLIFDYRKCIRCYCCQELCPAGAIVVKTNFEF